MSYRGCAGLGSVQYPTIVSYFFNRRATWRCEHVLLVVSEFGITLDEVNWLGNIIACIYLPVSLSVPEVIRRYGIRRCVSFFVVA
jgi:hypothetical protein